MFCEHCHAASATWSAETIDVDCLGTIVHGWIDICLDCKINWRAATSEALDYLANEWPEPGNYSSVLRRRMAGIRWATSNR